MRALENNRNFHSQRFRGKGDKHGEPNLEKMWGTRFSVENVFIHGFCFSGCFFCFSFLLLLDLTRIP